jgi:hypothetical protein
VIAKTTAERQRTYRARKAEANLPDVRGIYAVREKHPAIKSAAKMIAKVSIEPQTATAEDYKK